MMSFHTVSRKNSLWLVSIGLIGCSSEKNATGDGNSSAAPDVEFYAAIGEDCCGEDPHPVHGIETPDNGFLLSGKSLDSEGNNDGFLVKIGSPLPTGSVYLEEGGENTYAWSTTFGTAGRKDAANAAAIVNDDVFVVGIATLEGQQTHATLRKYDLASGNELWSSTFPPSDQGLESAFESIQVTSDGGIIVAGLVDGEVGATEGFKSYGNPTSGTGTVQYFSSEQLSSSSPPSAPEWQRTYDNSVSVRAIRAVDSDGYVMVAANIEESYFVSRLDSQGDEVWREAIEDQGEATDIAVLSKEGEITGFAVTGHKGDNNGIDGAVTKLDPDGIIEWTKFFGNPEGGINEFAGLDAGNPTLIYDECWGIQATANGGAVIACGTGIEGCDGYLPGSAIKRECRNDPRTKWRALTIELDENGEEVWHRTDSYYFPDETEAAASAAEYVIRTQSGQYASVIDQDFGIGLMLFQ